MVNLTSDLWEYVEGKETKTKEKVYNWLNKNNLGEIVVDNQVFWIELVCSQSTLPDYILSFIKTWCKARGYTYLYDMPTNY